MREPDELQKARECLAKAEAAYRSDDGLVKLAEGLGYLDDVLAAGVEADVRTARNLAATYAGRLYDRLKRLVDSDPALPEPELERFFKLVLAFDQIEIDLPKSARDLKIGVVRQLIERYYEGHPPEAKEQALRDLERLRDE